MNHRSQVVSCLSKLLTLMVAFLVAIVSFPSVLRAEVPPGQVQTVPSDATGKRVAPGIIAVEVGAGTSVEHVIRVYGPEYQKATGEPLTWGILQAANPSTTIPVCFVPQNGRKYIARGDTSIWDNCPEDKKGVGLIAGHSGRIIIPGTRVETYASKMKQLEELKACIQSTECLTEKLTALSGSVPASSTTVQPNPQMFSTPKADPITSTNDKQKSDASLASLMEENSRLKNQLALKEIALITKPMDRKIPTVKILPFPDILLVDQPRVIGFGLTFALIALVFHFFGRRRGYKRGYALGNRERVVVYQEPTRVLSGVAAAARETVRPTTLPAEAEDEDSPVKLTPEQEEIKGLRFQLSELKRVNSELLQKNKKLEGLPPPPPSEKVVIQQSGNAAAYRATVPAPQSFSISNTPEDVKRAIRDLQARIRLLTGSPERHAERVALDKEIRDLYQLLKETLPDLDPPVPIPVSDRVTIPDTNMIPAPLILMSKTTDQQPDAAQSEELASTRAELESTKTKLVEVTEERDELKSWKFKLRTTGLLARAQRHHAWLWGLVEETREELEKCKKELAEQVQRAQEGARALQVELDAARRDSERSREIANRMTEEAVKRGQHGMRFEKAFKKTRDICLRLKQTVREQREREKAHAEAREEFKNAWEKYIEHAGKYAQVLATPNEVKGKSKQLAKLMRLRLERASQYFTKLTGFDLLLFFKQREAIVPRDPHANGHANGAIHQRKITDKGMPVVHLPHNGVNGRRNEYAENLVATEEYITMLEDMPYPNVFIIGGSSVSVFRELLEHAARLGDDLISRQPPDTQEELRKPATLLQIVNMADGLSAGLRMSPFKETMPPSAPILGMTPDGVPLPPPEAQETS
jgi:hypothetical protein